MGKYQIITKQVKLVDKGIRESFDEIFDAVSVYDIVLPFKVINEEKTDVTDEFIKFAKSKGYQFIDIKDVLKSVPNRLKKACDKYLSKKIVFENNGHCYLIHFVGSQGLKGIEHFYDFWEEGFITFAYADDDILILNKTTNQIYRIGKKKSDLKSKTLFSESDDEFVSNLKKI